MRHPKTKVTLVSIILMLVFVEGGLQLLDPWGASGYDDWLLVFKQIVPHSTRDFALAPNTYELHKWTVTELPGNFRYIPDNQNGRCKVVFLGDSVTWSTGVSDNQAWVDLVAKQIPEMTAINPAFDGYNSDQIRRMWTEFPQADAGIYIIISNDDDVTTSLYNDYGWLVGQQQWSMTARYLNFMVAGSAKPNKDETRFNHDMDDLASDNRLTLVTFDDAWGRAVAQRWSVHLVPRHRGE